MKTLSVRPSEMPPPGIRISLNQTSRLDLVKLFAKAGRVTPCAPFRDSPAARGAHGVTRPTLMFVAFSLLLVVLRAELQADEIEPQAPPAPPPIIVRDAAALVPDVGLRPAGGPALYSIGQPTDEEQLYLEYINRARANPPAEGSWLAALTDPDVVNAYAYFSVNTTALVQQFSTNLPAPPLSMSSNLVASARRHSQDMFMHVFQGHTGTDGSTLGTRLADAGYSLSTAGENVYSYALSVLHGHAGFNVDWGYGANGMQVPPGHRLNILSSGFREVGIGVVLGSNSKTNGSTVTSVGPQLVTQDFGSRFGLTPFITGVAYFDFDHNGFYDPGEGLGGVRVDVGGASRYAMTANSGGFSVPVPSDGSYPVTFSFGGQTLTQRVSTVSGGKNVKLDFTPAYQAPVITGTTQPFIGWTNHFTFSPVITATNYQWRSSKLLPYSLIDGAEYGGTNMIITGSSTYPRITNSVKYAGTYAFHFAHPAPPGPQILEIKRLLRPGTNAQLRFASRLGWASADQVAHTQISTDGGVSWASLWSQAGTSSAGETTFKLRTNSLAAFAGEQVRVRFVYDFSFGTYYSGVGTGYGWYLDDLSFSGVEEVTQTTTNTTDSAASFGFNPPDTNRYELSVRALLSGRVLDFGSPKVVAGIKAPPQLAVVRSGTNLWLRWPTNQSGFTLQASPTVLLSGSWTSVPGAPSVQGTNYQVTVGTGAPLIFYRLRQP